MPEYETLDDHSIAGSDSVEPDSKPESPKVSGRAWGRLLKLFDLSNAAVFVVITEFFEKVSYFGVRAILVLYFTKALILSESKATSLYHVFIFLSTSFTIVGAFLSDFCFGRYRSILMLSVVYLIGTIVLSVTAIPREIRQSGVGAYIGLFLISLGSGGIRSSVSPFGADQISGKEVSAY
ncbi:peptide transporter family 1-like [Rhincodon typus]|uniref:peptide transporter family 1-like n=1 Tax=Rhincodon typus TaxID=259920 RepID=UPI00202E1A85|nr:peptide transporter family 1-like [Rhincodon typus]